MAKIVPPSSWCHPPIHPRTGNAPLTHGQGGASLSFTLGSLLSLDECTSKFRGSIESNFSYLLALVDYKDGLYTHKLVSSLVFLSWVLILGLTIS